MSLVMKVSPEVIHSWVGLKEWPTVYLTDPPLQPRLTGPSVKWKIADPSIVKQDERGYFNALKVGETTITAISDDGQYQATAVYKVEDGSNITITGFTFYNERGANRSIEKYIIGYGESVVLGARSHSPIDNELAVYHGEIEINHGGVTWSSSDPEIATVVPDDIEGARMFWRGKVTAGRTKSGTAMIRVTSVTCPEVYSEFPIVVQPEVKHIKSIRINPSKVETVIGQKYPVEVIINPSDATDKKLFWSTSVGSNCLVTPTEGGAVLRGIRKGSEYITVSSQDGDVQARVYIKITDGVVPLSKLELSTYELKVEMDTDRITHYPSVTAYVPTDSGQAPESVGINVDIKDPDVLKIREIKVLSEKSNRRAIVFKGGKPGYTTVRISSKTDSSKYATLEVMVVDNGKTSNLFFPYTILTVPDSIEVKRGQIFSLWAKGFGGQHFSKGSGNKLTKKFLRKTGDTCQSYAWFRAGYIPGDYEIKVTKLSGGQPVLEYGEKTVRVKIIDELYEEGTNNELIPSVYYINQLFEDDPSYGKTHAIYKSQNPFKFYLGWITKASSGTEPARRLKDSEYDDIGWKIARDGIIAKIEPEGRFLNIYRGPNY